MENFRLSILFKSDPIFNNSPTLDGILGGILFDHAVRSDEEYDPAELAKLTGIIDYMEIGGKRIPMASEIFINSRTKTDVSIFYRSVKASSDFKFYGEACHPSDKSVKIDASAFGGTSFNDTPYDMDKFIVGNTTHAMRNIEFSGQVVRIGDTHISKDDPSYCHFIVRGDKQKVLDILSTTSHIGTRRGAGYGEIANIVTNDYDDTGNITGIVHQGQIIRPIPISVENDLLTQTGSNKFDNISREYGKRFANPYSPKVAVRLGYECSPIIRPFEAFLTEDIL